MEAVSDILKSLDNELPTPEQIEVSKSQREVSKSTLLADVEDIENRHPEFQLTGCNNNDSGSTPLSKRACHSIQSQINSLANDLHSKLNLNTTPSSHNGNKRNFDLNLWTTPLHEHSFSSSFNNPDYGEDDLTDYNSAMFENDYSNFAEVVKANSKAAIRTFVGMTDLDDSREAVYNQYRVDLNGDRNDASSIRVFSSHNNVVGADYSFQRPSVTLSSGMVTSTPALMIHGGITEIESEDDISNVPGIQSSSCNNKNGESSNFTEKEAVIEEQENTKLYLSEVNNFSFNNSTNQILEDTVFFDTLDTSSVDVPPVNTVPNNTVMDSSTQAVGGNIEICGNTNEILNRSLKINENVENYATSESVFFKAEERGDKSVIEKSRLSFSFREDNEFNLRSVCETSKLFDAVIDCGSETDCAESIAEKVETTAVDIEPLSNRHSFGMSDKHGEQFAESTKLPVTSSRAEAKTVGDCAANEGSGTKSNCSDEGKNAEDLFCGNRESDEPNGNDWFSKSTIENEETRDESYFAKYLAAEEDITPESVTNEWNGKISAEKEDTKPSSEIDINDSVYDDASSDFEQTSAEVTQYENDLERDSSKMDRLNVAAPPVVDTSSANEQTEDVVCGLLATSFESTYEKKRMSTNSTRENIVVKDENFEHHQQYDAPEYTNIRRNQYSNGSLNIPADNDSGPNNSESTISPAGNENSVTRVVNDFDLATPTEIDFCNTNDSSSNELNKLNNMNNSNMEITKSPALYSKNHFDVENIDDQNETDEILTENESSKLHRRMDNSHIVEKLPAALSSYSESLCKETAAVITFREQVQNNYDATSDQNDNIQELPANVLDLESENGIVELSSDTVEDFKLNVENITNPHLDESQISRENSIVADSDSTKTGNRAIEDPNLTVPFDDFDTKVNFNHSEVDNSRVEIDLQNNDSPFASCDKSISDVPSEDINSKLNETVQEVLETNSHILKNSDLNNSHVSKRLTLSSEELCKETTDIVLNASIKSNCDSDQNNDIHELRANVLELESENGTVELSSDTVEDFKLNVENITNPHLDESQISRENSIVADSDSTKTGNRAIEDPNLTVPFDDFDTKVNFNHSEVDNTRVEIDLQNNDSPFASCDKSISDVPSEDINSKLNETVQEVLETDSHILKNSDLNNSHVSKRLTLSSEELCKETTDIVLNASIKSNCDSDQNNDIHELRANVLELESENGTVELSSDTVEDFKLNVENITNPHLDESQISRENSIVADSDSTKTGNRAIEDPNLTVPFDDFDTKVNFNHSEVDNTRVEIDLQNNDSPFASCDKSISDVPLEDINSKLNETVQEVLETDSHILKNSDLNNSHVSKRLTLSSEELCKETTDIVLNASIKSNCDATSDQNNDIHELRANVLELESENGTVELSSDTVEDFKLNAENITNTHLEESQISRENSIVADSDSTKTGNRAIEDPNLTVPFDDFDTKVNFNHSEVDNTRVEIDLQNNDSPFASCDKSISDVPLEYINSKLNETDKVQDGSNILRKIAKCKSKSVINAQSESTALEHALDGVAMDEKVLNHINKSALDFSNIQNGRQSEIENIVDQRSGGEENVNHAISEVKELIEEDPIRPDQSFAVINAEKSGEMQMETERDETRILLETCEIGETALAVNVNFLNNRNNSLHNTISECSPITVVQHEYYGMSEGKRICEDIATSEVLNKTTESSQQIKMDNLIRNSVLDISGNFRNDENVQAKLFDLLNSSGELIIDYSTRSSVVGVTDCEAVLEQATAGINSLELDYISDAEDNNLLKSEVCNDNDKAIVAKRGSDRYSQIADEQPIDLRNPPVTINKVETVNDGGVAEPDKTGAASLVVDDETGDASNCAKATKSDNENNADETVETIRRNSEDCDNSLTAENNADTSNRDVVNDFSANNVTSVHLNVANDSDNPLDVTVIEKEQNNANRSNTDKSRNRSVTETVDDLLLFDITPKIGYRRNRCSLINTPNCYSIMDMSPARFEHLQPRLLHEQPTPNLLDLSISKLESYNGCYSANENNSFSLMFSDDKLESGEKLLDISAVHVAGTPPVTFRTECLSVNEIQKKECSSVVIDYEGNRIGNATIKTNQECTDSSSNKSEDLSILRHTNDLISLMKLKQKEVENENHEFKKECTKQMDELKAQITTYEKKIDELITQSSRFQDDKDKLIKENEILKKLNEDLETSAKDAERRYLQGVEVNAALKQNEERMLETISNYQSVVEKLETKYKILKNHAHTELSKANTEIDYLISIKEKGEIKFNAQMSQMKVEIQSLRDTVKRLRDDNKQLQNICDDVINKFTVVPKH